ncbi:MAG: Fic family protein [Pseudomonadota bacterium]
MNDFCESEFTPVEDLDCCKRIGKMEYREPSLNVIACLAAFLRLSDVNFKMHRLLDIAPVQQSGMSDLCLQFICKRIGILLTPLATNAVDTELATGPILVRKGPHLTFLILKIQADSYVIAVPGYSSSFYLVPRASALLGNATASYRLSLGRRGNAFRKPQRHPKLWLLPTSPKHRADYEYQRTAQLGEELAKASICELPGIVLETLTSSALLASHLSICPDLSQYYGRYRTVDLIRGHIVFVNFNELEQLTGDLLSSARQSVVTSDDDAIQFAAKLFSDFLALHPFINANRRMATLIVSKYLERWGMSMRWSALNSSHYYYWSRCAQCGHLRGLEEGFRANIGRIDR